MVSTMFIYLLNGGYFRFFKYPFLAKSFNYERHCATIIQLNVRHFIISQMRMKACYTVFFIIQTAGKQAITLHKCTNDMRITFCLSHVYIFPQKHADHFILLTATANFCSTNMVNLAVDNGLMSCFTNNTCIAECYQGYIFPSGYTKESYSCQNGNLTPMLSTCKRKLQSVNTFIYLLPYKIVKRFVS